MRRRRSDDPSALEGRGRGRAAQVGLGSGLTALAAGGWLTGPLLLAAVISPAAAAATERSLVVHHLAHWAMVAVGAMLGHRLRSLPVPGRAWIAWVALGSALIWHLPLLLDWAEAQPAAHVAAHATLLAAGLAMGMVVPRLGGRERGALFIAATAVMWPVILVEVAGFAYAGYPGQAPAAGVTELLGMSLAWPAMAAWARLRRTFARPAVSAGALGLLGLAVLAGWMVPA